MIQFSVLMPVYNGDTEFGFRAAVKSVMENSILPNEFILVVDGPVPDYISDLIFEFQRLYGDMFKVFRLEENVGIVGALNFGLSMCTYELVARCDADDVNKPNRFALQLKAFDENDIFLCGGEIIEYHGSYSVLKKMPLTQKDIERFLMFRNPFNHMTVMFKKSMVLDCGGYPNIKYREDYALWAIAISKGYKVMNLPHALVDVTAGMAMYRRRSGLSHVGHELALQRLLLRRHLINRFSFVRNVVVRVGSQLLPAWIKRAIYEKFLRKI